MMETDKEFIEKMMANIPKQEKLLQNIKKELPNLEKLLDRTEDHWAEEDLVYRYYHYSNKVYRIQRYTWAIYDSLMKISPHENGIRNASFMKIIIDGTKNKEFELEHNKKWDEIVRPMLEAFFHSKYFLEMAVKYGNKYDHAPQRIESGWAALLELYDIR